MALDGICELFLNSGSVDSTNQGGFFGVPYSYGKAQRKSKVPRKKSNDSEARSVCIEWPLSHTKAQIFNTYSFQNT
jgi:hypothetical protein